MAMALAAGMATAWAQNGDLYKSYITVSNSYHFQGPSDYIVEGTSRAVALEALDAGTAMMKIDLNSGTSVTGKLYTSTVTGTIYGGARVLAIGGNYYQLGGYSNSTASSTALVKINGSTGAVMFSEYLTFKKCGLANLNPVDLVYDGSAYLYALGSLTDANGHDQAWVAKFDLNGVLQWAKCIKNNVYGSEPQNIYYYNDTSIYIGGKVVTAPLQMTGLIIRIDNNANIHQAKTISYFTSGGPLRMSTLTIKRNLNNLYVVAQPLLGRDDVGGLMIVKLDLNMNKVAYHVFDSQPYGFTYNPEFYFATNAGTTKILVAGNTNYYDNGTYNGYVNAFFDLNTNFLNANNLGLNSNLFGSVLSYPAATGHVFSIAQDAVSNTDMYYMKGAPGNDHTTCDSLFSFYPENDSLYLDPYPLFDSTMVNGTCTFTMAVSTPTFTPNSICAFCALCQKEAPLTTETAHQGEAVSLYPNPSNGHITLSFAFDQARDLDIKVMSLTGALMYHASPQGIERASLEYDLSLLPKGAYIVHITDDTGERTTKKIMIE